MRSIDRADAVGARCSEGGEFYKAAFGASELFLLENGGSVVAQLSVGRSDFWVADESPQHLNFSPDSRGGATTRMVMVVADPDRAVAAGGKVVRPVENQPYGWRVGRIVDPFAHQEIGTPL
jgi:PhnB protein